VDQARFPSFALAYRVAYAALATSRVSAEPEPNRSSRVSAVLAPNRFSKALAVQVPNHFAKVSAELAPIR
jgi:hypothetical protein